MNHRIALRGIFALGLGLLLSAGAQAQAFRTYLSASGNDANPCTLAAPCRLLPRAIATVIDGGEIWMLDSANYNSGPVDVNKSVTILAVPGALGSVVALGGDAIDIATPGVKVALRNLVIVPYAGGGGTNGIFMSAGASLTVEKCLIANLTGSGITVSAFGASVLVMDTVIKGSGYYGLYVTNGAHATVTRATISGSGSAGVSVWGTTAAIATRSTSSTISTISTTTADIADSTIDANYEGVMAYSMSASTPAKVSVRNSQVVRNQQRGLFANSNGGAPSLSVSNNIVSNNGVGLEVSSAARVWASGNTVSDNGIGLYNSGGLLESAGDNAIRNNSTGDAIGGISTIPKM